MIDEQTASSVNACPNCGEDLPQDARYCPSCGQKSDDKRVTVRDLVKDFFDTVFQIDSRLLRTLLDLFYPGRLTLRFFAGKHQSYYKPLRLFFTTMVIFLGVVGFKYLNDVQEQIMEQSSYRLFLNQQYVNDEIDKVVSAYGLDSLPIEERQHVDSFLVKLQESFNQRSSSAQLSVLDTTISVPMSALHELSTDSLMNRFQVRGAVRKLIAQQTIKFQKAPERMVNFAIGNATWMIILLIPALALFMKLFYLRRRRFYIEHLVFLYHFHAAAFVFISIYFLVLDLLPTPLDFVLPFLLFIFLFVAMKNYYRQNVFKSFTKFVLLLTAYLFTAIVYTFATLGISFLFFR